MTKFLVLFDGYCVLCSGFARWLHRKMNGDIQLMAMQSNEGQNLLKRYSLGENVDEVVLIENEKATTGASAILRILYNAKRTGRFLFYILRLFPASWIKRGYRFIADNRYKWFGKKTTCSIIQD